MRADNQQRSVALGQGIFNVVGGAWPLISLTSFQWVYGNKHDHHLQKAVGGLLVTVGLAQLLARGSDEGLRVARILGLGTALTFLGVDLVYIPRGEMRKTYLQDLLMEAGWIAAWLRTK